MKKVLSMLLIFAMILTMASFPAFAEEFERKLTWGDIDSVSLQDVNLDASIAGLTGTRENLFDGNTTSELGNGVVYAWFPATKVHAITINFKEVTDLSKLVIHWGNTTADGTCQPAKKYEIYVGTRGAANADQEKVYVFEASTAPDGMMRTDTIDFSTLDIATEEICLIRIRSVETYATGRLAVREIEIYENSDGTDIPEVPTPDFKEDSIETLGAGIRLADGDLTAGLRFGATVNKADAAIEGDYVYSDEANVKFGMYLLPAEKVDVAGGETLKDLVEAGNEEVLDVVAKKIYAQDEETLTYTAVLTGIPEAAYNKNIIALPYAKVGDEVVYYDTDANSYAGVAQAAYDANEAGTVTLTEVQVKALKEILGIEEEPEAPELTEQKVALTTDNITLQDGAWYEDSKTAEYWWRAVKCTGTGTWASTSDYAELVDGNKNVGLYYEQWRETVENGLYVDIIVDLKETKTVSKVSVTTGAGWDEVAYSAPMDSYIFLAGADGVYGDAVYTYTSNEVVNRRIDEIVFDVPVEDVRYVVYRFTKFQYAATIMEVEVYEMAAGTSGEGGETPEVPAEPALITGITVTADGITSAYPDSRPYSIICNGVSGEGKAIAWGDELFISAETYAPGDGSAPLFTLTFDLGAEYDVSRFFVGIGWDTGDITAADLYGSNDGGATWTPVKTGMATGWSAGFDGGDMIGVNLTNASYSMFKLEVMNVSKEANMQIHEIEFTGTRA